MKGLAGWQKGVLAILVVVGLALLAYPAPEPGFHGFHPRIQGLYIVSFLLVALPLLWIVGPRLKQYLNQRFETIQNEVNEAQQQFAQAEARLNQSRERLQHLTREVEALMAEFRALGERERDALAHEGAILSEKIRSETDFAMSQAVKAARQEVRALLVERALDLAEKRLKVSEAARVPDPLVDRFARDVSRIADGPT